MQLGGVAGCCELQSATLGRMGGLNISNLQPDRRLHAAGQLGGHPHT